MKVDKEIEEIILKANMVTRMDILVTDDEKIIYYIGDTEKCKKYLYSEISEDIKELTKENDELEVYKDENLIKILKDDTEKYCCQVVCPFYQDNELDKCIIFYKEENEFTEKEIFIISSTVYLIKKYLNKN